MVRTILCHPLTETKVFSEYYDPSTICCVEEDNVVVGSKEGTINVHRIDKSGCPREHVITATGSIVKILHCSIVNYLLTIESKNSESKSPKAGITSGYVRIYMHWLELPDGKYLTTHKAGYTEASHSLANCARKFLTIDIPMRYSARDIACCQLTGNIAVATETKVNIYACKKILLKESESPTAYDLLDFFPVAEVDPGIQLVNVSLSGPYLAYASISEMRALEISCEIAAEDKTWQAEEASLLDAEAPSNIVMETDGKSHEHSGISNDEIALDDHYTTWDLSYGYGEAIFGTREEVFMDSGRRDITSSYSDLSVVANASLITFDTIQKEAPYTDLSTGSKEIKGPKETIYGHPIKVSLNQSGLNSLIKKDVKSTVRHTTLLYKRLETIGPNETTDEVGFHSLQWLPVFAEGSGKAHCCSFLSYPLDKTVVALGLFISSQTHGFLYDALFKTKLLSLYNYTAPCCHAKLTISSLFSITESGLETYTVRLYAAAAKTCKDMVAEGILRSPIFRRTESTGSQSLDYFESAVVCEVIQAEPVTDPELEMEESYYGSYIDKLQAESSTEVATNLEDNTIIYAGVPVVSPTEESFLSAEPDTQITTDHSPFPLYQIETLLKPCPSTDIEICLIGVYSLRGLRYVGCTKKHVVLLVKSFEIREKRVLSGMGRKTPWNVYVLEKTEVSALARYLIGLIDGSEFANPMVYHQLLSEALFLGYSGLTIKLPTAVNQDLRRLLKELSSRAGDFFSRCSVAYSFDDIGEYYEMAKLSLADVLVKHITRDEREKISERYGPGIIKYLNKFVFDDQSMDLELSEDHTEYILHIYAVVKPCLLTKVIQDSNLKNLSTEFAVEVLESFRDEADDSGYKLTGQNLIVLVILYLKLCNPEYAETVLKSISHEDVVQMCLKTPTVVVTEEKELSPFCQLLQRRFPGLFTVVLKELIDHDKMTLNEALQVLGIGETSTSERQVIFNPVACEFLESILNDGNRSSDHLLALDSLLPQYKASASRRIIQDFGKGTHRHVPKGNGLFGTRYEWLDQMPPFSGEVPGPNDCVNRKPLLQSVVAYDTTPRSSPVPFVVRSEDRQDCSCCCCQNVLLKLQALLSTQLHAKEVAAMIMSTFEDSQIAGLGSIRLICFARTGQIEKAADLLAGEHISLILDFAKDVIKKDRDQLQALAAAILKLLKNNEYEQWNRDTYVEALKGLMGTLARVLTPVDFLASLPKDGGLKFFLPYIRECLQAHTAKGLESATLAKLMLNSAESDQQTEELGKS